MQFFLVASVLEVMGTLMSTNGISLTVADLFEAFSIFLISRTQLLTYFVY